MVDIQLGAPGLAPPTQERVFYRDLRTRPIIVFGTTENFAIGSELGVTYGRFFNGTEVQYQKNVVVLGQTPYQALFEPTGTDPIGKIVRVGAERYTVIGVFDKRPGVGGFNAGQDDFVVIPYTRYHPTTRCCSCRAGPSRENAIVPMNLLKGRTVADYVHTGEWSKKSIKEAKKYCTVNIAASSEDQASPMCPRAPRGSSTEAPRTCTSAPTRRSAASNTSGRRTPATCRWSPTCRRTSCRA